ncbi:unnamed protein product, partial [Ectocarpus sp. 12 AP-2014]
LARKRLSGCRISGSQLLSFGAGGEVVKGGVVSWDVNLECHLLLPSLSHSSRVYPSRLCEFSVPSGPRSTVRTRSCLGDIATEQTFARIPLLSHHHDNDQDAYVSDCASSSHATCETTPFHVSFTAFLSQLLMGAESCEKS